MNAPLSPTPRSTVHRHAERAVLDREALFAILDDAFVVHVGTPDPLVVPMAFGRIGDRLFLHAAANGGMLARVVREGIEVCVSATCVDGLVMARSAFRHSMNYRSAVAFGRLVPVEGEEKLRALDAILEHTLPGRARECRPPDEAELRATLVVALDLHEASVKVRTGPPKDAPSDLESGAWGGELPFGHAFGTALPDGFVRDGDVPDSLVRAVLAHMPRLEGTIAHGDTTIALDPRRLDVRTICEWMRTDTYWWTPELTLARYLTFVSRSIVVGAYAPDGSQRGFARLVTDGGSFAWLADVFVAREARGQGIATAMVRLLLDHPALASMRRFVLGTRDAHALYAKLGFAMAPEGRYMVRPSP